LVRRRSALRNFSEGGPVGFRALQWGVASRRLALRLSVLRSLKGVGGQEG